MCVLSFLSSLSGSGRLDLARSCHLGPVLLLALSFTASGLTGGALAAETAAVVSESPRIFPVSLGIPADCYDSSPYALNNGAFPDSLVVAAASNCQGNRYLPFIWRKAGWSPAALPGGSCSNFPENVGFPDSVADDHPVEPTVTLQVMCNSYNRGWVKVAGRPIAELPPYDNRFRVSRTVVSASGNHIVGGKPNDFASMSSAVRWSRTAEAWSQPESIGPGEATAVTDDGSVIVGNERIESYCRSNGGAWVWAELPGGGDLTMLDSAASARDIAHDGSMIVGCRIAPCQNKPNCHKPVPVYWTVEDGQWVMHDLQALDGVESVAQAVAIVRDKPVIAGYGYTNQDGGILRPVVWLPADDGSYGAPLRLEPIGGHFESWAEAVDINRDGMVAGSSDDGIWDEGYFPPTVAVLWNVASDFAINPGLNDAWVNPATRGQGFFINVFPNSGQMFVAWFTYDTERPAGVPAALADPGHRWLTAFGPYTGNRAELAIEMTTGGVFDAAEPPSSRHLDGTMVVEFSNCRYGQIHYEIPSIGLQGEIPIQRIVKDNVPACEALAAGGGSALTAQKEIPSVMEASVINRGLNDAWVNPATRGQGFFVNVFPNSGQMFLAWFTYETERPDGSVQALLGDPGHRWLTAFGPYDGNRANLDIEVTTGGVFNTQMPKPTQHLDGSIVVEMTNCTNGTLTYDIPSIDRHGVIPIKRIAKDNVPTCETLAGN